MISKKMLKSSLGKEEDLALVRNRVPLARIRSVNFSSRCKRCTSASTRLQKKEPSLIGNNGGRTRAAGPTAIRIGTRLPIMTIGRRWVAMVRETRLIHRLKTGIKNNGWTRIVKSIYYIVGRAWSFGPGSASFSSKCAASSAGAMPKKNKCERPSFEKQRWLGCMITLYSNSTFTGKTLIKLTTLNWKKWNVGSVSWNKDITRVKTQTTSSPVVSRTVHTAHIPNRAALGEVANEKAKTRCKNDPTDEYKRLVS